ARLRQRRSRDARLSGRDHGDRRPALSWAAPQARTRADEPLRQITARDTTGLGAFLPTVNRRHVAACLAAAGAPSGCADPITGDPPACWIRPRDQKGSASAPALDHAPLDI